MIKNYLTIAWRNLLRNKSFSLINVLGLSIGIAACIIIFLYVQYELTFDKDNIHRDNIARITATLDGPDVDINFATCPLPMGNAVRNYPEVKACARLQADAPVVRTGEEAYRESNFYSTDQQVFDVFTFSFLRGSAAGALTRPNTIVLTEKMARKYFGSVEVTGKTLLCNNEPHTITAVIANRPPNSDMTIDALLSDDFSKATAWMADDFNAYTFVLFNNKPNLPDFSKKLQQLSKQYVKPELNEAGAKDYQVVFGLEPLADVHFSKGKVVDTPKGNRQFNYIFSLLAIFILVIALLNYINLSTARATERAKEVGIRKVSGARPAQLIRQFLFESFLVLTIGWVIAFAIVLPALPLFNNLLQIRLSLNWQMMALFTLPAFVLTLLLAGIYPAFVLSGFRPVEILKGKWRNSSKGIFLRKSLTVAQFVITAVLITGSLVIYQQMRYIDHKNLGMVKDQVLTVTVPSDSTFTSNVNAFKQRLLQMNFVQQVSTGSGVQTDGLPMSTTIVGDKKTELLCNYYFIDPQFVPMLKIQLAEGRNFSDSMRTDKQEAFIVNEAFVQKMGWKSAVGQPIEGFNHKGKITGVVKNFYYKSLHNVVEPLVMIYNSQPVYSVLVKMQQQHLSEVKAAWKQYFPNQPFEYEFLDDTFAKNYRKDKTAMTLFTCFTGLAIFISCLGLYGLISLVTMQRTKEIGIRKVLGASLDQLLLLLTKDSVKLIVLASLIGLPVALYGLNRWLADYAYHINISWWMFVLPVLVNLVIALLVIAQQVIRAAVANPVKSLRTE